MAISYIVYHFLYQRAAWLEALVDVLPMLASGAVSASFSLLGERLRHSHYSHRNASTLLIFRGQGPDHTRIY